MKIKDFEMKLGFGPHVKVNCTPAITKHSRKIQKKQITCSSILKTIKNEVLHAVYIKYLRASRTNKIKQDQIKILTKPNQVLIKYPIKFWGPYILL